METELNINPN